MSLNRVIKCRDKLTELSRDMNSISVDTGELHNVEFLSVFIFGANTLVLTRIFGANTLVD